MRMRSTNCSVAVYDLPRANEGLTVSNQSRACRAGAVTGMLGSVGNLRIGIGRCSGRLVGMAVVGQWGYPISRCQQANATPLRYGAASRTMATEMPSIVHQAAFGVEAAIRDALLFINILFTIRPANELLHLLLLLVNWGTA